MPEGSSLDRVELKGDVIGLSKNESNSSEDRALFETNGHNQFATVGLSGPDALNLDAKDSQLDAEMTVSLKAKLFEDDHRMVFGSFEPFFRYQNNDGDVDADFIPFDPADVKVHRDDDVEAYYFGAQLAAEFESAISDTISLIGRAAAGFFYIDADIKSSLSVEENGPQSFRIVVNDSDDAFGGRFGAALGFKFPIHYEGATLSIVATADYLTDVATINHVDTGEIETRADLDDRLDIGARLGLIVPLN